MLSFGEQLRRERELREITLREVAEATKINLRYLQALERNEFAHLPGGLFNKGFVRAYCEYIGIDSETMVNAYLYEEQSQSVPPDAPAGVRTPRGETSGTSAPRRRPVRRFVALAVSILVILAALTLWLWLVRGTGGNG